MKEIRIIIQDKTKNKIDFVDAGTEKINELNFKNKKQNKDPAYLLTILNLHFIFRASHTNS